MENLDNLPLGSLVKVSGKIYRKSKGTYACEGCAFTRNTKECKEAPSCIALRDGICYVFKRYYNKKLNDKQITIIVIVVMLVFASIVVSIFKIYNPW